MVALRYPPIFRPKLDIVIVAPFLLLKHQPSHLEFPWAPEASTGSPISSSHARSTGPSTGPPPWPPAPVTSSKPPGDLGRGRGICFRICHFFDFGCDFLLILFWMNGLIKCLVMFDWFLVMIGYLWDKPTVLGSNEMGWMAYGHPMPWESNYHGDSNPNEQRFMTIPLNDTVYRSNFWRHIWFEWTLDDFMGETW